MIPHFAREEFEAPLSRVVQRVDQAIEQIRAYTSSPMWGEAVTATLAISRAPKHLIRSQLVLLGSVAGGGKAEGAELERFAAGVELLHLFMLVHDDVMDNASLRRGKPTLRVALQRADPSLEWVRARDLAIVVGNMLNVLSMRQLMPGVGCTAGEAAAGELMLDACCRAGAGQFQDLLGWRSMGDSEEAFRRELIDKTAYQAFAAPFAAGLRMASAEADLAPALSWGCRMGLAFQAIDDLTDLVSSPAITGKDSLRDLLEGRPSLPLLLLRKRAVGGDREFIESLGGREAMIYGERVRLGRLVQSYEIVEGCAEYVRAEIALAAKTTAASGFTEKAREGMATIERSLGAYLDEIVTDAAAPSE
jgi:geranylgeranyl diphosphate synthase type I